MTEFKRETEKRRLLLLGGGYEQLNALRIAKELGADVIVFDGHADAPCSYEASEFFQVDIKDHVALIAKAKSLKIDAIFVHAAELAIEAALVAEKLGLPGISTKSARLGTDKAERSRCLAAAGVSVPKYKSLARAASWANWLAAAEEVGFPLMAKPTALAGARGVQFIENRDGLKCYFDDKGGLGDQDFLLETYVQGIQLSTESVAFDDRLLVTSIALRHYDTTADMWPFQIEDGHSMPWQGSSAVRRSIENIIDRCRRALEIKAGVLKGDIIVTGTGDIIVLEMAVRTSGGRFCDTVVPFHSGINILYPLIQFALGQRPDHKHLSVTRNVGVSQRFVLLSPGTPLKQRKEIQHLLLQQDVVGHWFRDDIHALEKAPHIRSHRDRLGYVICTGETREVADHRAKTVVAEIAAALIEGDPR